MMIIKHFVKQLVKRSIPLMRLYIWYRRKTGHYKCYPNWQEIIQKDKNQWTKILDAAKSGKKILLATSMGGLPTGAIMDSILAVALSLRSADVHVLLCDSFLPACLMCEIGLISAKKLITKGPRSYFCKNCFSIANRMFEDIGIKVHKYSELVTQQELDNAEEISCEVPYEEIGRFSMDGLPIGEHAMAGALRFFARGTLEGQVYAESVLRLFLKAAILTQYAVNNLFNKYNFECASFINGIYVPQGIIGAVARSKKVRVVNWSVAYRKCSFIFSHNDTYHHTLMSEPTTQWENINLTPQLESKIMEYLISRQRGGRDWITFQSKNPNEDISTISKKIKGINFSKPCIGMLTNVVWDAQLHYPANAFPNMVDWVLKTIKYFSNRPELQLVIRVHPAEISGDIPSRQPIMKEIQKAFPVLPKNIFIIKPNSRISTYKVMEMCNAVIIYGTKTGVELTSRGIPVIVAGEAWIRNKGLTIDAKSEEDYFKILDRLPLSDGMSKEQIKRARKYAYHFFFRRMIPVTVVEPTGGEPQFRLKIENILDLQPGKSLGLDIICNGILNGKDFVYPAEKIGSIEY